MLPACSYPRTASGPFSTQECCSPVSLYQPGLCLWAGGWRSHAQWKEGGSHHVSMKSQPRGQMLGVTRDPGPILWQQAWLVHNLGTCRDRLCPRGTRASKVLVGRGALPPEVTEQPGGSTGSSMGCRLVIWMQKQHFMLGMVVFVEHPL